MTPEEQAQDTQNNSYPPLPAYGDVRWQEAVVAARKQRSTQLRPAPRTTMSTGQATVFAGDIVYIIPEVQYQDWIVARIGRKLGWLNTDDVDFVDPAKAQLDGQALPVTETFQPAKFATGKLSSDRSEDTGDLDRLPADSDETRPNHNEAPTRSKPPARSETEVHLTVEEIDRIMENLKGIALALQAAKERALKQDKPASKKATAPRKKKSS